MAKIISLFLLVFLLTGLHGNPSLASSFSGEKIIKVDLNKKILELYKNGKLIKKFSIRVGKKRTPTPKGNGYVYIKRKRPIFRYQDPPHKGKIIRMSQLSNGKTIKVPHEKMRALGFRIKGSDTYKFSIHSTTHADTIGKSISNGCIGLNIEDMLELYPLVEVGTKIIIN